MRFQENQFIGYYLTRNERTDDQFDVAKLMCALLRPFITKGQKNGLMSRMTDAAVNPPAKRLSPRPAREAED